MTCSELRYHESIIEFPACVMVGCHNDASCLLQSVNQISIRNLPIHQSRFVKTEILNAGGIYHETEPSYLLVVIAILCVIIVAGAVHIAIQNVKDTTRFTVESILPEGTVSQRENLTFAFSDPVVEERLLDKDLDYSPIEFTPEIRANFDGWTRTGLRFFPGSHVCAFHRIHRKSVTTVSHSPAIEF